MKIARGGLLSAALLGALVIAGCGSSSSSSSTPSSTVAAANTTQSTSSASSASAPAAGAKTVLVSAKTAKKLGKILDAGPKHLTVYLFEADKGHASACTGACAAVWPPVTGKGAAHGGAVSSDLGTITRSDGTVQVTYKGHPLYYFVKDKDDGDAYGQGLKEFGASWYVLKPNGSKIDES
jgi:predicted lipoprotein with Yx(FWY)xxD motif